MPDCRGITKNVVYSLKLKLQRLHGNVKRASEPELREKGGCAHRDCPQGLEGSRVQWKASSAEVMRWCAKALSFI